MKRIKIYSVEEYIRAIKDNCSMSKAYVETINGSIIDFSTETPLSEVWFRGEPENYEHTYSSLFRETDNKNVALEKDLMDMALQYFPQLFEKCHNTLEKLVTMQHYTLATRLVDVSKNPLVALYFACQNNKKNGRVLFTKEIFVSNFFIEKYSELIEWISENHLYSIDEIFNALSNQFPNGLNSKVKGILFKIITDSFLFLPKYTNDRIRNQQGALIFSALFEADDKTTYKKNKEKSLSEIEDISKIKFCKSAENVDDMFDSKVFFIPKDAKADLLKELDNYGINEAFIYPEPEHQMKYVNWYCNNYKYKIKYL